MSADPTTADVYNGLVTEWEALLRSHFADVTWELGRYSELDAHDKVEHFANGTSRVTGIMMIATGQDGKHHSHFAPITPITEATQATDELQATIMSIAKHVRTLVAT